MATLVLGAVGAAVGGSLGGSFLGLSGAVVGRAVGATLGRVIDQSILGAGADAVEVGRLDRLRLISASEGAPIPRAIGRVRLSGQVIWASRFRETRETTGGGGKGAPRAPKQTSFSYSVSLAVAVAEGEITRIGRIWADGKEIARSSVLMRVYRGTEDQMPDSLIEAIEGADNAPAFRGVAYVMFEDLDLTPYGNRVPQLSFEVVRTIEVPGEVPAPSSLIEGVALVPGSGEFALATTAVHFNKAGEKDSANVNTPQGIADFRVSMDDLVEELPNLKSVSLLVSWFGDDLRCGECEIKPRVEHTDVEGTGQFWNVSGQTRATAGTVPMKGGRPVYGGTPSDLSVIEAIRDLNERGLAITFYPFIMMDQLAGNGLPDPYGSEEQPALPWRGRITTGLAAHQNGSSDRTLQARTEVEAFFGRTDGSEIIVKSTGSTFRHGHRIIQGPADDWSYRRFILHYAKLCAEAGGVEAFCIGSEMRGLTRIRAEGDSFPSVEALRDLARDVRGILPDTKISYAADWSEYYGYQPADTGNVHFNLDPLWADPAIDFVGIDNYMPLADWRDGDAHLDAAFRTTNNLEYLQSNIEGGEGFDWHYPTPEARASQRRVPISDGAHGEPWVYRYKDIRSWWTNAHHDRIDGTRAEQPTAWVPGSKPIRFTEYGCAAIDRGANQPNKFIDEKSSESSLPRHSDGRPDDTMQMQYLRSLLAYWNDSSRNPKSEVYDGRMVDLSRSLAWAWDTRPWPYFPELASHWSDAQNYARGHWISGRTANQPLANVVAQICSLAGLRDYDVSRVEGVVRGYVMANVQSARADLQPLMMTYGIEASEQAGRIVFFMRADAPEAKLDPNFFVRRDGPVIVRQRAAFAEAPKRVLVNHMNSEGDFEIRVADAGLPGNSDSPVSQSEVPLSLSKGEAHGLAERFLTETNISRDTVELELAPSMRQYKPGQLIQIDETGDLWRIDRLEDAGGRKVQAVRTERAQYEPSDRVEDGSGRVRPLAPLPVDSTFLELPLLTGEEVPYSPYIAVSASPWPGTVAIYSSSDDANYGLNSLINLPTVNGVTETVLDPARPSVFDNGPELLVRVRNETLESVSLKALLSGANAAAINDGSLTGWEVFQFQHARLVAPGLWGLSRRLRGQRGTEWTMCETRPIGSTIVFLGSNLAQLEFAKETLGVERYFRTGPARLPLENEAYLQEKIVVRGEGLRPYAPAHLRATRQPDGVAVSWIRRSRVGGDGWGAADVPTGEARERYRVQVLRSDESVSFEIDTVLPEVFIDNQSLDNPEVGPLRLSVAQISEDVGSGAEAYIAVP
ncbi:Putative phage tail protein [Jannaschia faecimaris]|uniref:Putative phage tail protein n=1 Tax=Jannaschia faecimaris TaxID=1244108 RepID=A0A1H3RZD8_9RHOB|nr:glycoside hydrolase/phage tail family protein [Jannaschia faecimaris]SDZ30950.1 Putative phage tail protein [Jannaschia faecimaris]